VLVKNIDNVQPCERRQASIRSQRLLAGLLARLQRDAFALLVRLEDGGDDDACDDARAFLSRWFERRPGGAGNDEADGAGGARCEGTELEGARRRDGARRDGARLDLAARLDRPLRVAGMVPVSGEPGGGPFWVRGGDGEVSKQIVESAEIAAVDEQRRVFESSTHFNPVLMALGLRDRQGRPYRLSDYVDPARPFVSARTAGGAALRALEHPGLWNGSMAGWNTVFVEVSPEAFTPVKTVLDLLRPEHLGRPAP